MRPSSRINVHPSDRGVQELSAHSFDVIFIGSGWAARIAAARLVKAGLQALIIEKELVGGECPFWACVPSKVLLRPGEALKAVWSVGGAKEAVKTPVVDVASTFQRRDAIVHKWHDVELLVPMVEDSGVHICRGMGSLCGERNVSITDGSGHSVEIEARLAVVCATGSEPIVPRIPGIEHIKYWTPRDATSSNFVPKQLIILGAGAVGVEMATAYASFGSKVTLLSASPEILPMVDEEAGEIVRASLQDSGVTIKTGCRVTALEAGADDTVVAVLENSERIEAINILIAAGRQGVVQGIGIELFQDEPLGRYISVDEHLTVKSTRLPGNWLYAVGDVNGRSLSTQSSKYHGRIVADVILARSKGAEPTGGGLTAYTALNDEIASPRVIFTSPAISSVGFTRKSAAAASKSVREITAPFVTLGGIISRDKAEAGWAQWLVDDDDRLVGATFVGHGAADVLHASTVAIMGGLRLKQLAHAVPSFLTSSEVYLNLIDAAGL